MFDSRLAGKRASLAAMFDSAGTTKPRVLSKVELKPQPALIALEVAEIERARKVDGAAGDLEAPRSRNGESLAQPHIDRRTDEQGLAGITIEAGADVVQKIVGLGTDEDAVLDLPRSSRGKAQR